MTPIPTNKDSRGATIEAMMQSCTTYRSLYAIAYTSLQLVIQDLAMGLVRSDSVHSKAALLQVLVAEARYRLKTTTNLSDPGDEIMHKIIPLEKAFACMDVRPAPLGTCLQGLAGGWNTVEDLCANCTLRMMEAMALAAGPHQELTWHQNFVFRAEGSILTPKPPAGDPPID